MDIEFAKNFLRDHFIFTIPFMAARVLLYPIVNINAKMQRQYQKLEEDNEVPDRYQKYQNFSLKEKLQCAKEIVAVSGFMGLYERCEVYLVPFLITRLTEGFLFFTFMRFCLDIMKMEDPLYLLTGLAFFFCNLAGSFCLKLFGDVVRERKDLKSTLSHVSPSNSTFWKQYEVELGYYHAFGLVQGYFVLSTFWHFRPNFFGELILFYMSRIVACFLCQPLGLLAQWASENNFDYGRVFNQIMKRDGKLGLFAGVKDMFLNEFIFTVTLVGGSAFLNRVV